MRRRCCGSRGIVRTAVIDANSPASVSLRTLSASQRSKHVRRDVRRRTPAAARLFPFLVGRDHDVGALVEAHALRAERAPAKDRWGPGDGGVVVALDAELGSRCCSRGIPRVPRRSRRAHRACRCGAVTCRTPARPCRSMRGSRLAVSVATPALSRMCWDDHLARLEYASATASVEYDPYVSSTKQLGQWEIRRAKSRWALSTRLAPLTSCLS